MISDIEKLYSPSQWCYRRCSSEEAVSKHLEFTTTESNFVRSEIPYESNIRYGHRPRQQLDIFEPENSSPTFVFIHGGYWQMLSKESSCYCVKPLIKAGIRVVVPDYDLAPDVQDSVYELSSLEELLNFHLRQNNEKTEMIVLGQRSYFIVSLQVIIEEIKELTVFLLKLSVDRQWGPLWLSGHSAGAHLASSVLNSDLCVRIAGLILISGIYDLRPLLNTSVNLILEVTLDDAVSLSPILQIEKVQNFHGSILLVVGEFDSPAFHEQQQQFAEKLKANFYQVTDIVIPDMDHFIIVENLKYNSYILITTIIKTVLS